MLKSSQKSRKNLRAGGRGGAIMLQFILRGNRKDHEAPEVAEEVSTFKCRKFMKLTKSTRFLSNAIKVVNNSRERTL